MAVGLGLCFDGGFAALVVLAVLDPARGRRCLPLAEPRSARTFFVGVSAPCCSSVLFLFVRGSARCFGAEATRLAKAETGTHKGTSAIARRRASSSWSQTGTAGLAAVRTAEKPSLHCAVVRASFRRLACREATFASQTGWVLLLVTARLSRPGIPNKTCMMCLRGVHNQVK